MNVSCLFISVTRRPDTYFPSPGIPQVGRFGFPRDTPKMKRPLPHRQCVPMPCLAENEWTVSRTSPQFREFWGKCNKPLNTFLQNFHRNQRAEPSHWALLPLPMPLACVAAVGALLATAVPCGPAYIRICHISTFQGVSPSLLVVPK